MVILVARITNIPSPSVISSAEYVTPLINLPKDESETIDFVSCCNILSTIADIVVAKSLMDGIRQVIFHSSDSTLPLGKIVEIRKGQQVNGTELLKVGKYPVMNGGITPSGFLEEFNTEIDTISISEGGNSCGYVQFNDTPIWSGGHCYTLHHINDDINYRYLYHFLKYSESEIMKLRIGSGLPNIQKKDLSRFLVAYYPISEQSKIASTLDAMEAKIFNEESLLHSLFKQKSYLLSTMFI